MRRIVGWVRGLNPWVKLLLTVGVMILPGIVGAVWYLVSRPDMSILVRQEGSTIPPEIHGWVENAARVVAEDIKESDTRTRRYADELESARNKVDRLSGKPDAKDSYELADAKSDLLQIERDISREKMEQSLSEKFGVRSLKSTPVVARAIKDRFGTHGNDLAQLVLTNESDDLISRMRLRFDSFNAWKVTIEGAHLTPSEIEKWQAAYVAEAVVLPEIPPIPANGVITITAYGRFSSDLRLKPIPASSSTDVRVFREAHVIDRWPASMALHPKELLILLFAILTSLWGFRELAKQLWGGTKSMIEEEAFPRHGVQFASWLTKRGDFEPAIDLLTWAVEKKATTRQAVRDDERFRPLWEVDAFREVFGEPSAPIRQSRTDAAEDSSAPAEASDDGTSGDAADDGTSGYAADESTSGDAAEHATGNEVGATIERKE